MPEKRYSAPAAAGTLEALEFMASNPGAGIGVAGLSSRLCGERLPELRRLVLPCAGNIPKSIGYQEVQ